MTNFYVIRHGQTDYNLNHKFQGRLDIPLNKSGCEQARQIAKKLKDVKFDVVFYSPLVRAKQTADEIHKMHKNCEFIVASEIIERDFGVYEGKTYKVEPPYYGLWDYNIEQKALSGGESMQTIKDRVFPFLEAIIKKYQNKNVALVCHGGVALIIREFFEGTPESGNLLDYPPIPNGEAAVYLA